MTASLNLVSVVPSACRTCSKVATVERLVAELERRTKQRDTAIEAVVMLQRQIDSRTAREVIHEAHRDAVAV